MRAASIRSLGVALALALGAAQPAAQAVYYVDDDAPPGGDGLSWTTAFDHLDDAFEFVGDGDEVRLARGRYVRSNASPDVDVAVTLRGGYGGLTSPWPDARAPEAWPTLLDGDANGDDGQGFTQRGDNAFTVLALRDATDDGQWVVLDGLTVRGGRGRGVLVDGSAARLVDCLLTDNAFGLQYEDAWIVPESRLELVDTRVVGNVLGLSLGINTVYWAGTLPTNVHIRGCEIADNGPPAGAGGGGGLYAVAGYFAPALDEPPVIVIEDTRFVGNRTRDTGSLPGIPGYVPPATGAGAFVLGSARLTRCVFADNVAEGTAALGGGAFFRTTEAALAFYWEEPRVVVASCTFADNVARGSQLALGGGAYGWGPGVEYRGCEFTGNRAEGPGDACGGAVAVQDPLPDVYVTGDQHTFRSCTVVDNHADGEAGGVFLVDLAPGSWSVVGSILWGNTDRSGATAGAQYGTDEPFAWVQVATSCVQGLPLSLQAGLNTSADPRLSGPAGPDGQLGTPDDGRRLLPGSPCIDAGLGAGVDHADLDQDGDALEPTPLDRAGRLRAVDDPSTVDAGGSPDGLPVVDLGAYEFGAPLGRGLWFDRGHALAGALGAPRLHGSGDMFAGTPYTLRATRMRPQATAILVLGLSEQAAAFKGGVMVPSTDVLALLPTGAVGTLELGANWPQFTITEQTFWWQIWVLDPDAVFGFAATNALSSTTP